MIMDRDKCARLSSFFPEMISRALNVKQKKFENTLSIKNQNKTKFWKNEKSDLFGKKYLIKLAKKAQV